MEGVNPTMKLSDAILAGAKLRPQTHGGSLFGWASKTDPEGEPVRTLGSCALGAAYEAIGGTYQLFWGGDDAYERLRQRFPFLKEQVAEQGTGDSLMTIIYDFNDRRFKTREWIAEYVRSLGH